MNKFLFFILLSLTLFTACKSVQQKEINQELMMQEKVIVTDDKMIAESSSTTDLTQEEISELETVAEEEIVDEELNTDDLESELNDLGEI